MNIRKEHIDALNAVVKITIGKYEYTEKIENFLEVKEKQLHYQVLEKVKHRWMW